MPSGVPEYQDEDGTWRDEYGEQVAPPGSSDSSAEFAEADGDIGWWEDESGGTAYGVKGDASVFHIETTDPAGDDYEFKAGSLQGDWHTGEHGFGMGVQATAVEFSATGGEWDEETAGDERFKGGASVGAGAGFNYSEEMDADGDGYTEQAIGLDVGPFSLGYQWEEGGDNLGNTVEEGIDTAGEYAGEAWDAAGDAVDTTGEALDDAWEWATGDDEES